MANPKGNKETLTPYQPKWRSGKTRTIRVPIAIADEVLEAARAIDEGKKFAVEEASNTDTSDTNNIDSIKEAFNELGKIPSNRGGQIKEAASKIARLIGLNFEKDSKRKWKIIEKE